MNWKRVWSGKFYQPERIKSHLLRSVFIQGDALIEESENEEAPGRTESVGGFFIKHGTFMGTENELAISQSSDVAASDSDYDTDLETEGKLKLKLIIKIFLRDGWDLS